MNEITAFQATTLAIACVGAVLGVINTWRTINNDRVRLLITPVYVFVPGVSDWHLAINVVNQSVFPVTITHVGFDLRGTKNHMQIFPDARMGSSVPCKLEARTSASFHLSAGAHKSENFHLVSNAYVSTGCGRKYTGTSPALSGLVKDAALTAH
jgi:hypothetical protein